MIFIYTPDIADQVADNRVHRTELEWLVYNEPLLYTLLVLCGAIGAYIRGALVHILED